MIESKMMADVLRNKMCISTPRTDEFENECGENGCRKYGQKNHRWWDKSTGRQIEHLICWFSRKYYGGSTQKCIDICNCRNCAFKKVKNKPEDFVEEKEARKVFGRMKKPEMYICIAEVLEVLEEKELIEFVKEIKDAIDRGKSWKCVCNKYLNWEMVDKKITMI